MEEKNKKTLLVLITIYCTITIMAASMYIAETITQLVYNIHDLHQIEAQLDAAPHSQRNNSTQRPMK